MLVCCRCSLLSRRQGCRGLGLRAFSLRSRWPRSTSSLRCCLAGRLGASSRRRCRRAGGLHMLGARCRSATCLGVGCGRLAAVSSHWLAGSCRRLATVCSHWPAAGCRCMRGWCVPGCCWWAIPICQLLYCLTCSRYKIHGYGRIVCLDGQIPGPLPQWTLHKPALIYSLAGHASSVGCMLQQS